MEIKTVKDFQLVDVGKLVPYINNARTHSSAQIGKLRASIREFGFISPLEAAKEEGYLQVPCVFADDLTEAQKKAYILADNRMAMDAGWDEELLRIEMEGLQAADFDISLTGFREDEITDLFAVEEGDPEDEAGSNKEYDEEEFSDEEFEHECPRCGFRFN